MVSMVPSRVLRVAVGLRRWHQLVHLTASHLSASHLTAPHLIPPYPTAPLPTALQSETSEEAGSAASMPKKRGRRRSARHRSRTARAELSFSVSHMEYLLLKGCYARRVSSSAPVFLAAIIQALTSKVLELAGNEAQISGQRHITPRLVDMALHNHALFSNLFRMTTVSLEAPGPR